MKLLKLLVLTSTLVLMGCNKPTISSNPVNSDSSITDSVEQTTSSSVDEVSSSSSVASSSEVSSSRQEASSSQITTSSVASSSSEAKSSSIVSSSSEASSSSAALSSSEPYSYSYDPATGIELRINLFNSTCPTAGSESINDTLAEYINECAEETLVSNISNVKCQIGNGFPTKTDTVLIIGASSTAGELDFTFTKTIKAMKITVQTYHKPYTSGGQEYPNVDPNSKLCVNTENHLIDLTPVDGQPVTKEYATALNSNSLKLFSKEDNKGRVFVKELILIY